MPAFYSLALMMLILLSPPSLSASTVLITGANRGLGLEFARQYQAKGFDVIATARSPRKATDLNALGVRVEALDVTDEKSVAALASRLKGVAIDVLINNAGINRGRHDTFEELSFDDLTLSFAVNSIGPMRVTRALLPNLRAGESKQIISISSQLGSIENNSGGMYGYRASKAALNQLNKSLSLEYQSEGFTCVVLHPGWVRTDMGGDRATYSPTDSIRGMIQVIDRLSPRDTGRFLDLNGQSLPW